jgi:putative ABC transport system permease protein
MKMFKNYFVIMSRSLWKNKFFSLLNVLGLAIGVSCYLLIFQYVHFELSYDRFHEQGDHVYRLQRNSREDNGKVNRLALTSYNVGPALRDEFPEVEAVARCLRFETNTVSFGDHTYKDEKIYVTEPAFLKLFTIPLLQGNARNAIRGPNRVMLSAKAARKYFGQDNPLDQTIRISTRRGELDCLVTGVFEDIPENSHMKFDMLMSLETMFPADHSDWIFSTVYTYLLLTPGADPTALTAKLPGFIDKYILKTVPRAANWTYRLQPLRDIYLYSDLTYDTDNGNGQMVYFLLIIAFLILTISWINYVNLSTARAMERAREVGLRKVVGGHRLQLIKQFLTESLLINVMPIAVSVLVMFTLLPHLRDLTGKNIPLYVAHYWFWLHLFLLYIAGSLLSGVYPAFVLSSFPPTSVLGRTALSRTTGGNRLRKILVSLQFVASAVLIILTASVYQQIQYMKNRDLGIRIDHVIGIPLPNTPVNQEYVKNVGSLKTELLRYPAVRQVTGSLTIPGSPPQFQRLTWKENTEFKTGKILSIIFVDDDFLPAYRVKFLAGRNFSQQYGTDSTAVVLNEAAAQSLGYGKPEGALNQNVEIWEIPGNFKIIGVIQNYHQQSLKKSHEPIVFLYNPLYKSYYSVRLNPVTKDIGDAVSLIRQKWQEIFPGYPFDYFFLEDFFNRQYRADYRFGKVLGLFVILAIMITCLGLLGLSSFNTYQRKKEIAIRKTLGAGSGDILQLLTADVLKLVAAATVLAWPIGYYLVRNWLQNYAFRIPLPWLLFILSPLLLALITLLTIGYHTIRAAHANPVDALKEE